MEYLISSLIEKLVVPEIVEKGLPMHSNELTAAGVRLVVTDEIEFFKNTFFR